MESISPLMDATLGARWLRWLCPQTPARIRRLSYGAGRVYSPSPAVRSKPEVNCQSWRESTFNLEEAIRGSLFPVNAMDEEDKADWPQSMKAGSGVKHTVWSFQWTVWLATFPRTPGSAATASTCSGSKSLWRGVLKVPKTFISHQSKRFHVVFEISNLITSTASLAGT